METRGISLGQVQWGNPDSEPSFWPNEVMHWSWVQNIAQSKGNSESLRQIGYPTEILMADILRLAVLRRLQSRVIDWRQWVESDADSLWLVLHTACLHWLETSNTLVQPLLGSYQKILFWFF